MQDCEMKCSLLGCQTDMEVQSKKPSKKLDLSRLNSEQRTAVLHVDGPLLILAGAGSGKTNTMTHRIAYLIAEKNIPAHRILGMSFTNKAASELKDRVNALVTKVAGSGASKGLIISTFHSLCVRILREFAPRLGYTSEFSILDTSDQEGIVKEILKYINIDSKKFDQSWILFQIGQAKNRFLSGDGADRFFGTLKGPKVSYDDYSVAVQSVFPRYQERLKLQNAMDFDDLLSNTVTLLEEHPDVRQKLSERFQYILVDEYQDTNAAQFRMIQALTSTHHNICVVGDDDQSIYAWRGADPSHILEFHQYFPNTKRITLSQNYRSTEIILKAANEVIAKNSKRHPKDLWSERGPGSPIHMVAVEDDRSESQMVTDEIMRRVQDQPIKNWKDYAILYRSNAQSRIFEEALRLHQIPYKLVGAMSFLDRKEVKDLLCYWKLVVNPQDDSSIRRVINWPPRGIGKSSIELVHLHALNHQVSFYDALKSDEVQAALTDRAKKGISSFLGLIDKLHTSLAVIERQNFLGQEDTFLSLISEWAKDSLMQIVALKIWKNSRAPSACLNLLRSLNQNSTKLAKR